MKKLRTIDVEMDELFWEMVPRLDSSIKARAKKRELPLPSRPQIFGAILSDFFLRHYEEILSEQDKVALETARSYIAEHFHPRELAVIVGATISEVQRSGTPDDVCSDAGVSGQTPT